MKKILFIFAILFYACTALAQVERTERVTGLKYLEYSTNGPLIVYYAGLGEDIRYSEFVKKFVPANRDRFTIVVPYQSSWEKPMSDGKFLAVWFMREVKKIYPRPKPTTSTGFSLGASFGFQAQMAIDGEADVVVICAGSGSNEATVNAFGATGIPVRHYHASGDRQITIDKGKVRYTWLRGRLDNNFIEIPGGSHGTAPAVAYAPETKLGDWILSFGNPINPVIKDPVKSAYFVESEGKLIIETESGKTLRFTPD